MASQIKKNGILLSDNPSTQEICNAFESIMNLDEIERLDMHMASRAKWSEEFSAETNARRFCRFLDGIANEQSSEVVIVTNGYPYVGERVFIENELSEIYKNHELTIISLKDGELRQADHKAYDENIERIGHLSERATDSIRVFSIDMSWSIAKYFVYFPGYFFDRRIVKERKIISKCGAGKTRILWESFKYYAKARYFWKEYKRIDERKYKNAVFYTFWHTFATLAFCMNKDCLEKSYVITREHGYDLYDERCATNRQPFRETMEDNLDAIVFVCRYGKEYYIDRNRLSDDEGRYVVGYLGTRAPIEKCIGTSEGEIPQNIFRIVSCSNLLPIKRVERIIEAVAFTAQRNPHKHFEWIHFGDGESETDCKTFANSVLSSLGNVTYFFAGSVDNSFIHKYYAENHVDCFVTTSSTEGLPVSIIEAMSYGIPIIATDVGGIKEVFADGHF